MPAAIQDYVSDMGKFDSRNTKKMRQRQAQAKKKARDARAKNPVKAS